ncbi:MAG: hypothetical protein RRY21_04795 [Oscillospiraceae bacterium]
MKRILIFVLTAVLCCGCAAPSGPSSAVSAPTSIESAAPPFAPSDADAQTQLPNPMVGYDAPDSAEFSKAAGFSITGLPTQLDDTAVTVQACWLIGGRLAQLDLSIGESLKATLRAAPHSDEDISGVYRTFESVHTEQFGDQSIDISESAGGPGLLKWTRDGYDVSLYLETTQMGLLGAIATAFPEALTIEPAKPAGEK